MACRNLCLALEIYPVAFRAAPSTMPSAPEPHSASATFTPAGFSLDIDSTAGKILEALLIQAAVMTYDASTQAHITTCHGGNSGMAVITELTPLGEVDTL